MGDALTATNAYAYGTSDDERCSWCGVSPKDLTRHCGWYCSLLKLITQVAGYLSSSASQSEINAIANANLAVAQSATVTQS
ncbi:MAG: hypothetical protein KME57_11575 [Scytonema hyalinum WJT4-NPBG1]|nr:hypothetical protein [Scytonema hyalinum WJT4-NPBG1]